MYVNGKTNNSGSAAGISDGLLAKAHFIIKHCLFGRKFAFGQISTDGDANQRLQE